MENSMKKNRFAAAVCILFGAFLSAANAETGIRFDAVMMKDGVVVARPSVWSGFDQQIAAEVPGLIRFVAQAGVPVNGRSMVKAKFYYFDRGEWRKGWEPEGEMQITLTPSFEYTFKDDERYRIVLKPRQAERPQDVH
jgi:hypothetical protein